MAVKKIALEHKYDIDESSCREFCSSMSSAVLCPPQAVETIQWSLECFCRNVFRLAPLNGQCPTAHLMVVTLLKLNLGLFWALQFDTNTGRQMEFYHKKESFATHQVAVAVHVVHPSNRRPELVRLYPRSGECRRGSGVRLVPVVREAHLPRVGCTLQGTAQHRSRNVGIKK